MYHLLVCVLATVTHITVLQLKLQPLLLTRLDEAFPLVLELLLLLVKLLPLFKLGLLVRQDKVCRYITDPLKTPQ